MQKKLKQEDIQILVDEMKQRFTKSAFKHTKVDWDKLMERMKEKSAEAQTIAALAATGGEPNVLNYDAKNDSYLIVDFAAESPKERRSLCYDTAALNSRKENKPKHSAVGMAEEMGAILISEEVYHQLQAVGTFDVKTSSWLATPDAIRALGGSIFGDKRFGRTFIYHNGAESYYASRGFRCMVTL